MKKLIDLTTSQPVVVFFVSLLFSLLFVLHLPEIKTVDNVDYFTIKGDPDKAFYESFKKIFGNDEFFIIAFQEKDIFTHRNLSILKDITEKLEELPEVRKVRSLANVDDIIGGADFFEVRKFLEAIPSHQESLTKLKRRALENPLYVGNIISKDGRTAAIAVLTHDRPEEESYRKVLLSKCQTILKKYKKDVEKFYLAGWTVIDLNLSQYMKKDLLVFIPVTYLMITLALYCFFRNLWLTVIGIANISICLGTTMGLFPIIGIKVNNVTTIVPPLVMALSLSDTVHIFSHLDKKLLSIYPTPRDCISHVLKRLFVPCLLTSLTTGIGFLSLGVSKIPPIREFAWVASAGMLFEFVFTFFFLSPLLIFVSPEKIFLEHRNSRGFNWALNQLYRFIKNFRKVIVIGCSLLIILSCMFAFRIKVETNLVDYFKQSSPVRIALDFVEKHLSGVSTFDISFKCDNEDAFKDPKNLKTIEKVQNYINTLDGIDKTTSFVDFIKQMNKAFHNEDQSYYKLPDSRKLISQYLLLYDSDEIEDVINDTYDHTRIAVRSSKHGSKKQEIIIDKIKDFIASVPHRGMEIRVTGRALQQVNTIGALVKGQVYSLTLAAIMITIIMFIALRSFAIGVLSIIPNIFPIALNFGIMGAAGIPLNTATALIATVALGIAVDDTIHFLSTYRNKRKNEPQNEKAVNKVILTKGRAIISSSLILCIGFGVLTLSRFIPTLYFGFLSTLIMITALIGDIIFLPAIICLGSDRE